MISELWLHLLVASRCVYTPPSSGNVQIWWRCSSRTFWASAAAALIWPTFMVTTRDSGFLHHQEESGNTEFPGQRGNTSSSSFSLIQNSSWSSFSTLTSCWWRWRLGCGCKVNGIMQMVALSKRLSEEFNKDYGNMGAQTWKHKDKKRAAAGGVGPRSRAVIDSSLPLSEAF